MLITVNVPSPQLYGANKYFFNKINKNFSWIIFLKAEDYDSSDSFPVILLKGAKVGDYNGRTLSVTSTTVVQINPDIPEAHTVKGWFEQGGSESEIQDLSSQGAGGSGMGAGTSIIGHTNWKFLDQLKDEKLGMGDKADYFSTKAYVLYAKKDNSMYTACPGENCNKKIFDQNDGTYRCEKCARNYPNFKWRMILNVLFKFVFFIPTFV